MITIDDKLPFIKKDNFLLLFPDILPASFNQNIKNWLKTGKLIKLKRGLYITKDYYEKCADKDGYVEYLSSIINFPSYISKETALSKYGMLSEAVFGMSAVSSKATRSYISGISVFTYSKIKETLFNGFHEEFFLENRYYFAKKSKALFDYLYFQKRKLRKINGESINSLRVNFEKMDKKDWDEFEEYLKIAKSAKMNSIYKVIRAQYAV
ncbi:MAG: hypothetical protein AABZ57_04655 [Candidatus Margulisiibacteriota bacterium]